MHLKTDLSELFKPGKQGQTQRVDVQVLALDSLPHNQERHQSLLQFRENEGDEPAEHLPSHWTNPGDNGHSRLKAAGSGKANAKVADTLRIE